MSSQGPLQERVGYKAPKELVDDNAEDAGLQEKIEQGLATAKEKAAESYATAKPSETKDDNAEDQGLATAKEKAAEGYAAANKKVQQVAEKPSETKDDNAEDAGLQEKIEKGLATAKEKAAEGYAAANKKVQQVAEKPSDETQKQDPTFMDKVQGGLSGVKEKMVHGYEAFKHQLVGSQAEKPNVPDAKEKVKQGIEAVKQTGPVEATKALTGDKEEGKSGKVGGS
ncbi:unnamed protein product [Effrenium voratum]|uniref:Uncharacterized protein n=1 Tax=Effrenium voratum TaxID=2562239 RepID=A0AA36I895_9DINO|nr:unnamed protein product [Effrenium voratum]